MKIINNPLVTIVIPTRNRGKQLGRLLQSINESNFNKDDLELIVVNNGESLKLSHLHQVIENGTNKGLAFARNQGAKAGKGKYILFIDDDNVIHKDMIKLLVEAFNKDENLLVAGPETYYLSHPDKVWFIGSKYNLWTTKPSFYREIDKNRILHKNLFPVEIIHNCLMVRKVKGEKIGWFDEKVFMNGTEFDFISRLRKKFTQGYSAIVLGAKDFHDIPVYSKDIIRSLGFENPLRAYYFQRNRGVFIQRYGNIWQKLSLCIVFYPLFFLLYLLIFISKNRLDLMSSHIKGTLLGYYYLFRPL